MLKPLIACVLFAFAFVSPHVLAGESGWEAFVEQAERELGEQGHAAAEFLVAHRPERDENLSVEFLMTSLRLALAAREEFPWARAVPQEMYYNNVLPYAVLDETREAWRGDMLERCRAIVEEATTASEAAQLLNEHLYNEIDVHYNTGRKKPNQSPAESIEQGRATCTGLSIILVDACRAVGIPARVAGVANWADKRGNHTWVEIWDGAWHFTGADEYNARGLNRGWFTGDASRAIAGNREHAVWASSWRETGETFPLVWAPDDESVHAVDVTARYAASDRNNSDGAVLFVRVWDTHGGERIAARIDAGGTVVRSRAGTADLNDMPRLKVVSGKATAIDVEWQGDTRAYEFGRMPRGAHTVDLFWDEMWLTHEQAAAAVESAYAHLLEEKLAEAEAALAEQKIVSGNTTMRILDRTFGEEPEGGHSLWISMHGGGGAPAEVNDQQWQNQIRLYELEEGIYVAPRAPTDTWNLWHRGHIDGLLTQLIEDYVVARNVDPNRVYLMGYSAGGDGVYQLAPRMPDRFAAAAMMAGHPNETTPDGLRNLPFAVLMGGRDTAYDRARVAGRFGDTLDAMQSEDTEGYEHRTIIFPESGHWMDGKDAEIIPWMAGFERRTAPDRIVWKQDDVQHARFYWLRVPESEMQTGGLITATIEGQTITLESETVRACDLLLRDDLVDLDTPVRVVANGEEVFIGMVRRTERVLRASLEERLDRDLAATGTVSVSW